MTNFQNKTTTTTVTDTEIREAETVEISVLTEYGVARYAARIATIRTFLIAAFMIVAGMTVPERISEASQIGPIPTSELVRAGAYSIAFGLCVHLIASMRVFRRRLQRDAFLEASTAPGFDDDDNNGGGGGTRVHTIMVDPEENGASFPWWLLAGMALFVTLLGYSYLKVEVFGG